MVAVPRLSENKTATGRLRGYIAAGDSQMKALLHWSTYLPTRLKVEAHSTSHNSQRAVERQSKISH